MGKVEAPRVPYHEMSHEERREAWARVRRARSKHARRHRSAPWLYLGIAVALWVTGGVALHMHWPLAGVWFWAGIGFLAFAVVAWTRHAFGALAPKRDDVMPPGFG